MLPLALRLLQAAAASLARFIVQDMAHILITLMAEPDMVTTTITRSAGNATRSGTQRYEPVHIGKGGCG